MRLEACTFPVSSFPGVGPWHLASVLLPPQFPLRSARLVPLPLNSWLWCSKEQTGGQPKAPPQHFASETNQGTCEGSIPKATLPWPGSQERPAARSSFLLVWEPSARLPGKFCLC